ncbi:hypothetical protein, variant [Batrachochytrium dendrobatidis JEL423]|nr:hypothetical protein O5D80_004710 [Batrachochytrium dendrobatidis]OAJ37422.1 hypothetical protein, variant [Batrachochytrium dendrobatidis JEL423]
METPAVKAMAGQSSNQDMADSSSDVDSVDTDDALENTKPTHNELSNSSNTPNRNSESGNSSGYASSDASSDTHQHPNNPQQSDPLPENTTDRRASSLLRRRKKKRKKPKFCLSTSNIISQLLFIWVFRLVRLCRRVSDIRNINFSLNESETAKATGDKLESIWNAEVNQSNEKASLLRALFKAFGKIYIPLALWKICWAGFTWAGSFWLLQWILMYQEARETASPWPVHHAYIHTAGLFVCAVFASLCFHQLTLQNTRIGIQCRAALMVLIYRKSLRLSYVKGGVGDVVNLISNECNRIAEACVNWHFFWSAALECVVLLALAIVEIGVAAVPTLVFVLVVLLPLQYALARYSSTMSYRTTVLVTQRVHLMSEILTAIKLIKFYAWERYYRKKVTQMREMEILEMRKALLTKVSSFTVVFIAPVVSTALCIVTMYKTSGVPKPHVAFTLLSLFNTLRYPLAFLPNAERSIAAATISLKKLETFFLLPEVDLPGTIEASQNPDILMTIEHADFTWDGDLDHPHIVDLSLTLRRSQVIGVVGDVGSGRSLLAAIMGQIKRTQGTVSSYNSTFGFIPQEPWLINATLRDNILFGLEVDEKTYADAIRFSGLTDDFLLLSNGDETFLSELNLSPSQRQRISLARCIYHNPSIVLMEDFLSDFDQNHAKRLFKECIRNQISKNRCIVMFTQQKHFLPECDLILVLKGGKVVEQGTYLDLKSKNVNFSAWVSDYVHVEDDPTGLLDRMNEIRLDPQTSAHPEAKQISPLQPRLPGAGPFTHFAMRKRAMTKPRSSPLALAQPITAEKDVDATSQNTLRQLIERNAGSMQNSQLNEQTISKLIERNQLSVLTGNTSRPPANFSNQDMVTRTIEANQLTVHSVHDFDVATLEPGILSETAQGRTWWLPYKQFLQEKTGLSFGITLITGFFIVHGVRFFSDAWIIFYVDDYFNSSSSYYLYFYCALCALIAFSVLLRGFAFSRLILQKSVALHERLIEAVLRAPMAFYDITPLGHILSFFAKHLFLIDEFLPETALQFMSFAPLVLGTIVLTAIVVPWFWATLPIYFVLGWFTIRTCLSVQRKFQLLEASNKSPMFAHLSMTLEGLFSIRLYNVQERFDLFNRTLIDADHKALYSVLLVRTLMALCIDLISSVFIYITALFVILFPVSPSKTGLAISNALQLLIFVPWFIKMTFEFHSSVGSVSSVIYFGEHVPREERSKQTWTKPDPTWPMNGEIEFKNITLRYHRYGVAVLKSVSFHILPKEKIAIVGRSGSGKTTLLMSLLRIAEPAEGQMIIDGIDTSNLSLSDLRSRIAVIPQEPVMLTGTIRSNLDPFQQCTDEEIWKALKNVHLGDKIQEMPAKLDTPIIENGKTFNLSERQLFCIARAILIKTSIVVFDEPTTSVDKETELLLQSVIRENFSDCTVIVLASRFRVIVQMDRVMVMHHGKVVEFDTPLVLMDNPKSKFSLMLSQTGDVDPEKLRALAQAKADAKSSRLAAANASIAGSVGSSTESTSFSTLMDIDESKVSGMNARTSAGSRNSAARPSHISGWDAASIAYSTMTRSRSQSQLGGEQSSIVESIGSPTVKQSPAMPRALGELFSPSMRLQSNNPRVSTADSLPLLSIARTTSTPLQSNTLLCSPRDTAAEGAINESTVSNPTAVALLLERGKTSQTSCLPIVKPAITVSPIAELSEPFVTSASTKSAGTNGDVDAIQPTVTSPLSSQ